jgi:anti-sigma regulatory factor (Ser/Thr protein kinase)
MSSANFSFRRRTEPQLIASWSLRHETRSAARARHVAAGRLADWGLDSLIDTAQLLISETVTNAVRYAPGPIRLTLRRRPAALRCEVEDASPQAPRRRPDGEDAESGRGLALLDALADAWGSHPTSGGKTTWFELPLPLPSLVASAADTRRAA